MKEPDETPRTKLRVENLSLYYGRKQALRQVNLAIGEGQITALVGPSGCGKTSLLKTLNRLSDMEPGCRVHGNIWMDGQNLMARDLDLISLRRKVGMIFQRPNPFPFSIQKNLTLPLREHGIKDKAEIAARTETALKDVGLWEEVADRLNDPAQALSGGQQQRLCLARALVLKPEVLLMDEPCSALDPISSATVENLITRLRGPYTIVVVTHNLAQARRIADELAVFWLQQDAGELIETGDPETLFKTPTHPQTKAYTQGHQG